MKKIASILFLLALLLALAGQLWIRLAFQLQQDEIAASLCINRFDRIPVCKGSCVLERQLMEDSKQQQTPTVKLQEITLGQPVHFVQPPISLVAGKEQTPPLFDTTPLAANFDASVFKPPAKNA